MLKQYQKEALIIFLLLAFIFGYFYQNGGYNVNSRFDLIMAIVQEGRLTIDTYQNRPDTFTGDSDHFKGHYYSDKPIGPAVVGAIVYEPLYWIKQISNRLGQATAQRIVTYLVIGIPSALAGSLIYILCLYLSKSRFWAYLVTLTITLGTLYFPYSIIFFSHQFSSSLIFGAFTLIFFLKERPELWNYWYLFLIGSFLGWAMISDFQATIIVIALVFYYFYALWRNQTYSRYRLILLPLIGGAIPLLLQMGYNKLCFGNFLSFGYINENFNSSLAQGFMGFNWPKLSAIYYMTMHPAMGLFWQSPALLLSVFGAIFMFRNRRYRVEAILAMAVIGFYIVIISGFYSWWGGWDLGPRYLIPILPFFSIFLAFVPKQLTWPLVTLSLVSFAQMLIGAAGVLQVPDVMVSKFGKLGFFEYSYIYSYCLKQLVKGNLARNLGHQLLGLRSWNSLIPLVVVIGSVSFFFLKRMGIFHHQNHPLLPS